MIDKVLYIAVILILTTGICGVVSADNINLTELQNKVAKLEEENKNLKDEIARLKAENTRLKVGMGGVAVYQYVGPWQGDAGKWRQYKQIAELKIKPGKEGYIKPGVVLKPVWGFENETLTIRSMGDLIKIENKINNIDGLATYFDWIRNKYYESSRYDIIRIVSIAVICLVFGVVFGEVTQPIRGLADRITVGVMTDFGEKKGISKLEVAMIMLLLLTTLGVMCWSNNPAVTLVTFLVGLMLIIALRKVIR